MSGVMSRPWPTPSAADTAAVREILGRLTGDAEPQASWDTFEPSLWPALFTLLDVAADFPRLPPTSALRRLPRDLWPELASATGDLLALQRLIDRPVVPPAAETPRVFAAGDPAATEELATRHTVHVAGLLDAAARERLDGPIARLRGERPGSWGALDRAAEPEVHAVFDELLAGDAFRLLTGFDPELDESTLTLSLQSLDPAGIGWHRDLYWPKEWIGEDVFAVLYALGSDSPEKGGAFLSYVPWENRLFACYRQEGEATLLWNAAWPDGRLLHAVAGYRGADTSRHLVILQCHRRFRSPGGRISRT